MDTSNSKHNAKIEIRYRDSEFHWLNNGYGTGYTGDEAIEDLLNKIFLQIIYSHMDTAKIYNNDPNNENLRNYEIIHKDLIEILDYCSKNKINIREMDKNKEKS